MSTIYIMYNETEKYILGYTDCKIDSIKEYILDQPYGFVLKYFFDKDLLTIIEKDNSYIITINTDYKIYIIDEDTNTIYYVPYDMGIDFDNYYNYFALLYTCTISGGFFITEYFDQIINGTIYFGMKEDIYSCTEIRLKPKIYDDYIRKEYTFDIINYGVG
jgi:hypothetical protein